MNAILILVAAAFTIKHAIGSNISSHKNWAIRLYLLVSGVWFFSVGLFFWLLINDGPYGYDTEIFRGTFLSLPGIGQYTIPLILFEFYLFAKGRNDSLLNYVTSLILFFYVDYFNRNLFGNIWDMVSYNERITGNK